MRHVTSYLSQPLVVAHAVGVVWRLLSTSLGDAADGCSISVTCTVLGTAVAHAGSGCVAFTVNISE